MKTSNPRIITILTILLLARMAFAGALSLDNTADSSAVPDKQAVLAKISVLPASFIENQGQVADPGVRYVLRGTSTTVHLTDDALVFCMSAGNDKDAEPARPAKSSVFKMTLAGANKTVAQPAQKLPGIVNYFIGPDNTKWHTNIPTYAQVHYSNVYPGIDMLLRGSRSKLKYEFRVAPGTSPDAIVIAYSGIEGLSLHDNGNLHIKTPAGEVIDYAPFAYQQIGGQKVEVEVCYRLIDENSYGFAVTGHYDKSKPLIIDPDLLWSTFLGGTYTDTPWGVAVDASGNVYVTGWTENSDFPTTSGAYDETGNCSPPPAPITTDVFITKVNSGGGSLAYSTYVGGSDDEVARAIAIDGAGKAYVTGSCDSGFPTTGGAYDTSHNGGTADTFVLQLSGDGSSLLYSTFLGGSGYDVGRGIKADDSNDIFVTGWTGGGFPTSTGAYDTSHNGSEDIFVTKLSPDGSGSSDLLYSSYLGGSSYDRAYALDIDNGDFFVAGSCGAGFPTTGGAYDTSYNGGDDVFAAQVSPDGSGSSDLVYSTFIGGSGEDEAYGIAVDSAGDVYITGETEDDTTDFPTTSGAYNETHNGGDGMTPHDAFIAKFSLDGNGSSDLVYSTFIGGTGCEEGYGIDVLDGEAYVAGTTDSSDFPTTDWAYDSSYGNVGDIFVCLLSPDGSELFYSTFVGTSGVEHGWGGIDVDTNGDAYVEGCTYSSDFPTTSGAYDESHNGYSDVVVFKLQLESEFDDINPATFDWSDVSDTWSFYLLDSDSNGYWCNIKYIKAARNLIDGHCKTNAGTPIPHYHFESDFNSTEVTDANRYWDWYYDVSGTTITFISDATNVRDSLAYAMDGYAGSANYDYWLVPSETSDQIFTDDCTKRCGQPPTSARANDRLAYEDANDIYQQATKVNSVSRTYYPSTCSYGPYKPSQIQWKCEYSGVYRWNNSGQSDRYGTPGRTGLSQPTGSPPTGTWDADYWDGADADVYYAN
jgi:hypothetical protein